MTAIVHPHPVLTPDQIWELEERHELVAFAYEMHGTWRTALHRRPDPERTAACLMQRLFG